MSNDALHVANLLERIGQLIRSDEQLGDLNPAQWAALRYLARANPFSRSPMAVTRYLGTTRGTTSQTLIALERKGYIRRMASLRDKRAVNLELTKQGKSKLGEDPGLHLAKIVDDVLGKDVGAARDYLTSILNGVVKLNQGRMFGICQTCRHFRRNGGGSKTAPHRCTLLEVDLSATDSEKICVEHESSPA